MLPYSHAVQEECGGDDKARQDEGVEGLVHSAIKRREETQKNARNAAKLLHIGTLSFAAALAALPHPLPVRPSL
jgi:hypothetical protein